MLDWSKEQFYNDLLIFVKVIMFVYMSHYHSSYSHFLKTILEYTKILS